MTNITFIVARPDPEALSRTVTLISHAIEWAHHADLSDGIAESLMDVLRDIADERPEEFETPDPVA